MISSGLIGTTLIIAIIVLIVFMFSVIVANFLLKRELSTLVVSTSIIGTASYILFFVAMVFSLRPMVRLYHGPTADVSMEAWNWLIFLPAAPAVACMILWRILMYRKKTRIS